MAGIGKPFSEMIKHGEMGFKSGKIKDLTALEAVAEHIQSGNYSSAPKRVHKRKEEDVSLILQGQSANKNSNPPIQKQGNYPAFQPPANPRNPTAPRVGENKRRRIFTPLGDSLENVLALLIAQKKITELAPPADPKGRQYDPSKKCAYHSGAPGHDTKDCWTLKHKIQNMIDSGEIVVKAPEQPNVNNKPLPQHNAEGVNMIGAGSRENRKYLRKLGEAPAMIDPSIWGGGEIYGGTKLGLNQGTSGPISGTNRIPASGDPAADRPSPTRADQHPISESCPNSEKR